MRHTLFALAAAAGLALAIPAQAALPQAGLVHEAQYYAPRRPPIIVVRPPGPIFHRPFYDRHHFHRDRYHGYGRGGYGRGGYERR